MPAPDRTADKTPTPPPSGTSDVDSAIARGESVRRQDEIEDAFFSGRSLRRIPRSTATEDLYRR